MNDLAQKIGHAIRNCRIEQKITQEKCKHPANTALPSDPISLNLVPT